MRLAVIRGCWLAGAEFGLLPLVGWRAFDRDSVGLQMTRSADSVAANIAEAGGRFTVKDKKHFLYIAGASLMETEHWIECARDRGVISGDYDDRIAGIAR